MTEPDTHTDLGAAMARLLLRAGAVQVSRDRPFVLAAGWASPVYVDCRRLIGEPRLHREATDLALAYLARRFAAGLPFDVIAGGETAGIPWAAWIADQLGLPLRYVRKRPLGIGRNAQVEGGAVEGLRVLLVDDLATDTGSKVAFTRGLRTAGAIVTDTLVLFYNRAFPGGDERLARFGLSLHALANWDDVLRIDAGDPLLDAARRAVIEHFLRDPAGWSANHGGRRAPMEPAL
ncbi:MAG TPA: orotate phosphoribosyltransferase [Acetobacteraceae bacterium]